MMRQNLIDGLNHIINSEVLNHRKKKKNLFVFLSSVIALSVLSVSVLALTANAQPSYSISGTNNSTTSNAGDVTKMGICEVDAGGPCNNN